MPGAAKSTLPIIIGTPMMRGTEITSLINLDAKPAQARDENNPLMQAVKKLTGK